MQDIVLLTTRVCYVLCLFALHSAIWSSECANKTYSHVAQKDITYKNSSFKSKDLISDSISKEI